MFNGIPFRPWPIEDLLLIVALTSQKLLERNNHRNLSRLNLEDLRNMSKVIVIGDDCVCVNCQAVK